MTTHVDCLWDAQAQLGEGPVWHAQEQALFWVDIMARQLHRWRDDGDQGQRSSWDMPEDIGAVLPCTDDGLVCALASGLHRFDRQSGELTLLVDPEPELPGNRLNDACLTPLGNIWVGSMDYGEKESTGRFYRVDPQGRVEAQAYSCPITNGPAVGSDGQLFFTDSVARRIFVTDMGRPDFNSAELFVEFADEDGFPDGMCCDSDGCLWVAHWGAGRVTRFSPQGRALQVIELPAPNITKCVFGGENLDTLFITTARLGLSEEKLARQPLAGALFSCKPGASGFAVPGYNYPQG